MPVNGIKMRVLFVHNKHDGCAYTLLKDAMRVVEGMKKAGVKVDTILVSSTEEKSKPCQARSPHGFLGIENEVVGGIAAWIKSKL